MSSHVVDAMPDAIGGHALDRDKLIHGVGFRVADVSHRRRRHVREDRPG